jgi:outer membrane protein TolC
MIAILFSTWTGCIIYGNDTTALSLSHTLLRAMQNNPLVKIERINTDAAVSILRENRYTYEPQIEFSYSTSKQDSIDFSESNQMSLSIYETLPTGTNIKLWGEAVPLSSALKSATGASYQNNVGFTITQSLLRGVNPAVNLAPLRKVRIDVELREEELTGYAQKFLMDAERAYWDLSLSGEEVKIYRYSLELVQRFLYEAEERLKTGSIAAIDLAAIRAEAASRERQLFDAATAYKQKILYLAYIMNAPEYWSVNAVITDTIMSLGKADALEEHIEAARRFRPDFRQAALQAKKGELDLAYTKNGLLPKLDFFISLRETSYAESFSEALTPKDPEGIITGGFTLQFPLTSGASREKYRRAAYSIEQQKLSIENFSHLLEYEVRSAHIEVLRAATQIETAKTVSALQQQKLDAEQEKLNVGKSTGYAVLQVQRDFVSANLDEARARTSYIYALLSLYFRDGTLLLRRGIKPMDTIFE